ncbi:GNAT family N-acetyltransferase [Mycobacterium sp. ITM-2016-00317]|uniref:GNAT family N-acetyltransferase n=1 Tax=Mycobacterium sp. ITM-2016-00317 TaxID=2099694 RepID=UPI000D438B9B|nr:GNAT family N-acetyltransferase [Mycobacterium sp. ITM-2016-00317]WNG87805.1 GNAT family N-acetyltransferase [Mycobacterium sp. ITM-2016-00317]
MTTDKTGAPTKVTEESDRFSIAVDGTTAGFTEFVDHGDQRIFPHTEIDDEFRGRGLASILVGEALTATRAAGKRVVPVCSMVAGYIDKHPEFQDIADPVTDDIERVLSAH